MRAIDPDGNYNKWTEAFLSTIGGTYTAYDTKGGTYVVEGFQKSAAVFAVIRQRYEKVRSIPYFVKHVSDKEAKNQLKQLLSATRGDIQPNQVIKRNRLMRKAYRVETMGLPWDKPNPLQTWGEIFALYELFMCVDGNCYFYILDNGLGDQGKGKPVQLYVLPAHLMTIVVKDKQSLSGTLKTDNPIDHYLLVEGPKYLPFKPHEIIHIKTPNPDFGQDGAHLYGQSPLRAALRNIQSFNEAVDNNNRMMRNSGAYGLLHGKGHRSLTIAQADQIKDKLAEMDKDTSRLGQITGVSAEIGFTRVGLTPQEMKVFEYLNFDEKQIANVLGWDARLLNQDSGATFDNLKIAEKRVVSQTTKPSLDMLADALNREFFPRFPDYKGAEIIWDFSELPEMQVNVKELVEWLSMALDRGVINRDEFREAIGYDATEEEYMERFTISQFLEPLKEAIEDPMSLTSNNIPHEPNPLPE